MISFQEAQDFLNKYVIQLKQTELLPIEQSEGRVCAVDCFSDCDMPPFDKSAMDGYGVIDDSFDEYIIKECINAGDFKEFDLNKNECYKIMTGAPVIAGTKKIIIKEHTVEYPGKIKIIKKGNSKNICIRGEDVKKGDLVLKVGSVLTPFNIGILAGAGNIDIKVKRTIDISVIVSGNELISPDKLPVNGFIRDTNSYSLMSELKRLPICRVNNIFRIGDSLEETEDAVKFCESNSDVILLTGGSSLGDKDFTRTALINNKYNVIFDKISVKPGKPTIFAVKDNKAVFGLPGNPVSVLLIFNVLVKQYLYKMLSCNLSDNEFQARLSEDFYRKNNERREYYPVKINFGIPLICSPVKYLGSGNINAYQNISHVMIIEEKINKISAGETVAVRQLWP